MEKLVDPVRAVRRRCSIRNHPGTPLGRDALLAAERALCGEEEGPFGNRVRLRLIAATGENRDELKGLHTYGFIKGAKTYLAGAVGPGEQNLEDFGYVLERADLKLTEMDYGSCWLGGSFSKSAFAQKMDLAPGEEMPCVISFGEVDRPEGRDLVAERLKNRKRLPWEATCFSGDFSNPLPRDGAGVWELPLELVRLAPSATNKQPWRMVADGGAVHFYLQRSRVYGKAGRHLRLIGLSDLQRVDMGIAFSHFLIGCAETGITGKWTRREPDLRLPSWGLEYSATFVRD